MALDADDTGGGGEIRQRRLIDRWKAALPNPILTIHPVRPGRGRWRTYAAELAPLISELEAVGALEGWP